MELGLIVGFCPACSQGNLVIVKDNLNDNFLVVCEECWARWKSPLGISFDNCEPFAVWNYTRVKQDEIKNHDWFKYVINQEP